MAGDWIKIEHALCDKPEVIQMSDKLRIDPDAVVGKLVRFWSWCDQQSIAGNALGVTKMFLDRLTHQPGFSDALLKVDWLQVRSGSLEVPRFARHNGQTAKARAVTNRRVSKHRNISNDDGVTNVTQTPLQKPLPEKRREEYNTVPARTRELLPSSQAVEQAKNAGVPEDFARYVYDDWFSREGKDGAGIQCSFPSLARKRWNREGREWEAGTHKGKGGGKSRKTEQQRDAENTGLTSTIKPKVLS